MKTLVTTLIVVLLVTLHAGAQATKRGTVRPMKRPYTDHYYKRLVKFENEPPIGPKDIVMLGNSLTEYGGKWNVRLKKRNVRNRGIIGDETTGVYDRLHQILPGQPAKIFLMIGINDVSHHLPVDSAMILVTRIIDKIQTESPDTKIYLQSLLPINESFGRYKSLIGKTDLIPLINKEMEVLAAKREIRFINLFPLFTEKETNVLRKDLTKDGLHLTETGYMIWCKALKRYL